MAVQFPVAPTFADPVIVDPLTGQSKFNPVWLRWFLDMVQVMTQTGGGSGSFSHELLSGLQGGSAGEYYHLTAAEHSTVTGAKAANTVLAGPASGAAAAPTFRALVADDLLGSVVTNGLVYLDGSDILTSSSAIMFDGTQLSLTVPLTTTTYIEGAEQSAPAAPAANGYRLFAQDNGAGKTELMVIFATGAAQQIAIQP